METLSLTLEHFQKEPQSYNYTSTFFSYIQFVLQTFTYVCDVSSWVRIRHTFLLPLKYGI